MLHEAKTGETAQVGEYRGFQVLVEKNFMGMNYLVLRGRTDYRTEMSASPAGNMVRMENCFNGIEGNIGFLEDKLEEYRREMEQAKAEYEKPFEYEQELKEKIARQNELNAQLDLENRAIPDGQEEEMKQTEEREQEERTGPAGGVFETATPGMAAEPGSSYVAEQPGRYPSGNHAQNEQNRRTGL